MKCVHINSNIKCIKVSRIVKNICMKLKIREIRKSKNITQKELAELCGISSSSISRYELEQAYPNILELEWVALALKVKITDLFDSTVK